MNHRDYTIIKKIINEINMVTELFGDKPLSDFEKDEFM